MFPVQIMCVDQHVAIIFYGVISRLSVTMSACLTSNNFFTIQIASRNPITNIYCVVFSLNLSVCLVSFKHFF